MKIKKKTKRTDSKRTDSKAYPVHKLHAQLRKRVTLFELGLMRLIRPLAVQSC